MNPKVLLEVLSSLLLLAVLSVSCHENPRDFNNVVNPHQDDHGAPAHGHGSHGNQPPAPSHARAPAPPSPGHGGPRQEPPVGRDNRLRDRDHAHDREHVKEHYEGVVKMEEDNLSEEELQFHYFKQHDYDKNNMLDGIELISAVTHFHAGEGETAHRTQALPDKDIAEIIDTILKDEDRNQDGYIDYAEFIMSQRTGAEADQL